jgi:hypothetical protein
MIATTINRRYRTTYSHCEANVFSTNGSLMREWTKEKYEAKEAERRKKIENGIKRRPRCWHLRQTDPIAGFTAWLAIFTGVLVFIAGLQWNEMRGSGNDFEAVQKAFVYRASFETGIIGDFQTVTAFWKNSGSTPAMRVSRWISWKQFDESGLSVNYPFPDLERNGSYSSGSSERTVMGPGQTTGSAVIYIPLTILRLVRERKSRVFVWGWTEYFDVFEDSKIHRTEFCNELTATQFGPVNGDGKAQTALSFPECAGGIHNSAY